MKTYIPTIGLEVHVELATKTKMFCRSKNDPDEIRPNVNVCPICMGHPGTLPTINKEAVKHVLRVGLALGGKLADYTEFDRKNYFYPDIPKGYQISQYKYPLVSGGELADVAITRVHLEEDTARSQHDPVTGESLIDFNRSSVPLMELVTEPVIRSAKQAGDFARELRMILSPDYLGVSEANLEKGEMRIEANISLSEDGGLSGTKVEVKNLNSFRAVERAIEFEIKRQAEVLNKGEKVVQETRGWDENSEKTFSQRQKEFSHDYRYFPDPDLPKLFISEIPEFQNLEATLPELPEAKRKRYADSFGLKENDVEFFIANLNYARLFEETVKQGGRVNLVANYIISDLVGLHKKEGGGMPTPGSFAELMSLVSVGEVSSRGAKEVLGFLVRVGGSPKAIAEEKGLIQKSDTETLEIFVDEVIKVNETVVTDYKNGNEKSLQFLIGQAMKESKGAGNPTKLAEILKEKLK